MFAARAEGSGDTPICNGEDMTRDLEITSSGRGVDRRKRENRPSRRPSGRITKTLVYGLSGFGAALAGIVQSSQVHTALATYGPGTEHDVIAAVVLGGTSIIGGNGSVAKTVVGVLFLGVLNSGMNILNVPADIQLIAKGVIIALALGLAQVR